MQLQGAFTDSVGSADYHTLIMETLSSAIRMVIMYRIRGVLSSLGNTRVPSCHQCTSGESCMPCHRFCGLYEWCSVGTLKHYESADCMHHQVAIAAV